MNDRRVLVLIGAGSAVFTRGLLADLISARDLGDWEIRLVDVQPEPLEKAVGLANRMIAARSAEDHIRVRGSLDRRQMLPGADFVVTCVGVGGRPGWLADHEVCMQHGVFQPVGDSVMPGGISRLLRTTPVLVEVARDVVELAPDAIFFNYSNPMTANVMAMARYAGAEKVVGLCHGMHHVQHHLAAFIGKPFEETSTLVRRHQPPDLHLRLPVARAGRLAAGAREARPRAGRAGRPGRHRQHLRRRHQGVAQPVLVGDLPLATARSRRRRTGT